MKLAVVREQGADGVISIDIMPNEEFGSMDEIKKRILDSTAFDGKIVTGWEVKPFLAVEKVEKARVKEVQI